MHEAGQSSQDSPSNQDPCNPDASSDLVQQEIARDLEKAITKEEDSGRESDLLAGHGQFLVHSQRGEPDVDAVHEGDDIKNEQERKESELEFSDGPAFDCSGIKRPANRAFGGGAGLEFSLPWQE